ncbi:MAG: 1-acyl-sn-glycerol-3-phosphate acyltransferase, partial [Phormidesmis sp.]
VPIGIQYRYVEPYWSRLAGLLSRLESQSGLAQSLSLESPLAEAADKDCYLRILRLGEYLIEKMTAFYARWYHQKFEPEAEGSADANDCPERLQRLLDRSLRVAEQFFDVPSKGTLVDRCRRLEEASWTYIYREDLPDLASLSPLDKGLADWVAQEASLRDLHMRMVESFVAVDGCYVREKPSFERCAETALLMSDMLARLGGDKLPARPKLGDRTVTVTIQPPIAITPRLADYQQNRRAGRAAVAEVTEEIRQALEDTIER